LPSQGYSHKACFNATTLYSWLEVGRNYYFIAGLPNAEKGFDSIWVIVDRLTKSAHFIPMKSNYHPHNYADIYFQQVVRLHGVPKSIVSDRESQFTTRFWERLHQNLGTNLVRSSAY
jgi:hypothetical protein